MKSFKITTISIIIVAGISVLMGVGIVNATAPTGGLRILGLGILDSTTTPALSIDPNNRILYASDGTTTALSWASGKVQATNGIKTGKIYPSADSTTAVGIFKADGTTNVLNVDTTNGRVGIGGTPSAYDLEVRTSSGNAFGIVQSNTAVGTGLLIKEGSDNSSGMINYGTTHASLANQTWFKNYRATGPLIFSAGGGSTAHLFIKSDGNVGIGTTAPNVKLDIVGGADGVETNLLKIRSNFTTAGTASTLKFVQSTDTASSIYSGEISTIRRAGGADMAFRVGDGSTGLIDRVTILANGNVGIGTTAPATTLAVASANVVTEAVVVGNVNIQSTSAGGKDIGSALTFSGFFDSAKTLQRVFASIEGRKALVTDPSSSGYLSFKTNVASVLTEQMRITETGNVGIGTTTPGSKLTVRGHIGSLGTIPTLTSAGTGASITTGSTDTAGEITEGTSATGAVITFATAYTNIPFATVTSQAGLAFSYTVSTTAITITNIGALSGTKLNYHVIARE